LSEQKAAVELLIHRILPGRESEFHIRINSSLGKPDRDSFRVSQNVITSEAISS